MIYATEDGSPKLAAVAVRHVERDGTQSNHQLERHQTRHLVGKLEVARQLDLVGSSNQRGLVPVRAPAP